MQVIMFLSPMYCTAPCTGSANRPKNVKAKDIPDLGPIQFLQWRRAEEAKKIALRVHLFCKHCEMRRVERKCKYFPPRGLRSDVRARPSVCPSFCSRLHACVRRVKRTRAKPPPPIPCLPIGLAQCFALILTYIASHVCNIGSM